MADEVVDLSEARARRSKRAGGEPFPDPLPLDTTMRVMRLAKIDGFSFAETMYATRTVMYWANGGNRDGKIVRKADWAMTIVNAMRRGWAVEGFEKWRKKNRLSPWMDLPIRALVWDDIMKCIQLRRQHSRLSFVPRRKIELVRDPRLS